VYTITAASFWVKSVTSRGAGAEGSEGSLIVVPPYAKLANVVIGAHRTLLSVIVPSETGVSALVSETNASGVTLTLLELVHAAVLILKMPSEWTREHGNRLPPRMPVTLPDGVRRGPPTDSDEVEGEI
jgi:hypothetical protein